MQCSILFQSVYLQYRVGYFEGLCPCSAVLCVVPSVTLQYTSGCCEGLGFKVRCWHFYQSLSLQYSDVVVKVYGCTMHCWDSYHSVPLLYNAGCCEGICPCSAVLGFVQVCVHAVIWLVLWLPMNLQCTCWVLYQSVSLQYVFFFKKNHAGANQFCVLKFLFNVLHKIIYRIMSRSWPYILLTCSAFQLYHG